MTEKPMRKGSKLAEHTQQLDEWFWVQGQTLAVVRERLANAGCPVSLAWLSHWRGAREWELRRQQLLNQIAAGARQCGQLEKEFGWNGPPDLELLIRLHRVLILQLSSQPFFNPDVIRRVTEIMRPVLASVKRETCNVIQEPAPKEFGVHE